MIYGIFGDIHSNFSALSSVLAEMENSGVGGYVCTGDVVGYASEPAECIDALRASNCQVVAGNHDYGVVGKIDIGNFNSDAYDAVLWTMDFLSVEDKEFLSSLPLVLKNDDFTLVHGTLHNPDLFNYMVTYPEALKTFKILDTDVCFLGHTHMPAAILYKGGDIFLADLKEEESIDLAAWEKVIINTGSVGQPRDNNIDASYVIYDSGKSLVTFKRTNYNINDTVEKIYAAGLPRRNGERLFYAG